MALATITTYEIYLAVHILAAVVWVGGALAVQIFAIRADRAGSGQRLADFAGDAEWIGMRIFLPSALVLVVFGFLLVSEGSWDLGELWVSFGMAVWLASFVVGAAFLGPESGRIATATERHGVESAEVRLRLRRIFLISRIELVFLLLVVLDMTLKPGS